MTCTYSIPGYDAWKTRLPDYWDWDDGEEDRLAEEEYNDSLESMIFPPLGYHEWEREPFAGPDVYPDDWQFEYMGWEP